MFLKFYQNFLKNILVNCYRFVKVDDLHTNKAMTMKVSLKWNGNTNFVSYINSQWSREEKTVGYRPPLRYPRWDGRRASRPRKVLSTTTRINTYLIAKNKKKRFISEVVKSIKNTYSCCNHYNKTIYSYILLILLNNK